MIRSLLAGVVEFDPIQGVGNLGDPGNVSSTGNSATQFTLLMSRIIGLLTAVAALWFIFVLITGAYSWLSAGSDKQSLDNAKKKITNGVVGLFAVVFAYTFIGIMGYILGIDIINLESLIENLAV